MAKCCQALASRYACVVYTTIIVIAYDVVFNLLPIFRPRIQFYERDPELSYIVVPEQVPSITMALLSALIPLGIIALNVIIPPCQQPSKAPYTCRIRGLLLFNLFFGEVIALILTDALTNTIKVVLARPRPIFYDLCDYQYFASNRTLYDELTNVNTLGNYSLCRSNISANYQNSLVSFPSGHSSFSFCGMLYASFMLQALFYLYQTNYLFKVLCFTPLYLSGWIAITRVQDMQHHVEDILGGALLGMFICVIVWGFVKGWLKEDKIFVIRKKNKKSKKEKIGDDDKNEEDDDKNEEDDKGDGSSYLDSSV